MALITYLEEAHHDARDIGVYVIPCLSCVNIVAQWRTPMSQAERCLMLRYDLATFAVVAQSDLAVPHHA